VATARGSLQCTLVALLAAWVTMVFVTSALVALLVPPNAAITGIVGERGFLGATIRLADEMGPAIKLFLIAAFAALALVGERAGLRASGPRLALSVAAGVAAMLLTLALIPESLSRGFGVRLTGARFDPALLPIYLACGALGGVAFTVSATRCRRRLAGDGAA
jgi:hypothetical protein